MVYTVSVLTNTNILTMNHCLALILGMSIKHTIMIFLVVLQHTVSVQYISIVYCLLVHLIEHLNPETAIHGTRLNKRKHMQMVSKCCLYSICSPSFDLTFWMTKIDYLCLLKKSVISSHTGPDRTCWLVAGYILCDVFKCNFVAQLQPTWGDAKVGFRHPQFSALSLVLQGPNIYIGQTKSYYWAYV